MNHTIWVDPLHHERYINENIPKITQIYSLLSFTNNFDPIGSKQEQKQIDTDGPFNDSDEEEKLNKISDSSKRYITLPINNDKNISKHRGSLYLRIGPMFSGKTTWLNGELTQLADKRFNVLKITHADDIRSDVTACDQSGSTHNSSYRSLSTKISCIHSSKLKNIDVSRFHVIGIDEAQFFPDLLEVVDDWVENKGKHVRVAGLCGDSFKRKFGQTLDLIPICDEVEKLNASCKICLDELENSGFHGNILSIVGPFTKRLGDSTVQKEVGGADKYIPVCRFHHANLTA